MLKKKVIMATADPGLRNCWKIDSLHIVFKLQMSSVLADVGHSVYAGAQDLIKSRNVFKNEIQERGPGKLITPSAVRLTNQVWGNCNTTSYFVLV